MVKTGYISFLVETGGGQDDDGNIIPTEKTPTDFYPCNLKTVKKEYLTNVDGQIKQAQFSIYLNSDLTDIDLEPIKEVSLQDNLSKDLGNYQIQNIEYLLLSKRIKIIV